MPLQAGDQYVLIFGEQKPNVLCVLLADAINLLFKKQAEVFRQFQNFVMGIGCFFCCRTLRYPDHTSTLLLRPQFTSCAFVELANSTVYTYSTIGKRFLRETVAR